MSLIPRPSAARMRALLKASCDVFGTVYNPDNLRMGNKILRKKLIGPTVAAYYPSQSPVKLKDLRSAFPMFEFPNTEEETFRMSMADMYVVYFRV
ncbi:mitochondrial 37S ribosomal protein mS33 [Limtongia smithiae]|uniref:mitochondrial 37S ribosomal protein mS33 n=1 Tax=Limtongia smithiae TaxID=1125753 RepID=UPI0034CD6798